MHPYQTSFAMNTSRVHRNCDVCVDSLVKSCDNVRWVVCANKALFIHAIRNILGPLCREGL